MVVNAYLGCRNVLLFAKNPVYRERPSVATTWSSTQSSTSTTSVSPQPQPRQRHQRRRVPSSASLLPVPRCHSERSEEPPHLHLSLLFPLYVLKIEPTQTHVISTEATHRFIVSSAVERFLYLFAVVPTVAAAFGACSQRHQNLSSPKPAKPRANPGDLPCPISFIPSAILDIE
jgi:hypothetical protein